MSSTKTYGGVCAGSHVKFKATKGSPAPKVKSTSAPKFAPGSTAKPK